MQRRHFIATTFALTGAKLAAQPVSSQASGSAKPAIPAAAAALEPEIPYTWHDPQTWGVEGRAWTAFPRKRYYARFPDEAKQDVPPSVWSLGQQSAGLSAQFKTNASSIQVKYKLSRPLLAMPHMPATGVSGVDLYARENSNEPWRWVSVSRPNAQEVTAVLTEKLEPKEREYLLYFPLYNGVDTFSLGVNEGATFESVAPRPLKDAIVFYGTSITHGACASRPGMAHVAILGRRLNRPCVNLGFSGSGKMDEGVGKWLAKAEMSVLVIDCSPNMDSVLISERCVPLVEMVRKAKPHLPIVLVEDRFLQSTWIRSESQEHHRKNHEALQAAYKELQNRGVNGLFYLKADKLLGDDTEGTTDGSHPNDLGFMRQADAMEPVVREALAWKA